MFTITFDQRDAMLAAQDEAAKSYWAYPDAQWQFEFQTVYLLSHYNVPQAKTPDGLVWGECQE